MAALPRPGSGSSQDRSHLLQQAPGTRGRRGGMWAARRVREPHPEGAVPHPPLLGPPHPGDENGTLRAPERLCVCVRVCVRQAFDSYSVTSSPNPGSSCHLPPLGEARGDLVTLRALLVSALLLFLPTFPPCSLSSSSPSSKNRTHIRCFCYQTRSYGDKAGEKQCKPFHLSCTHQGRHLWSVCL